MVPIGFYKIPNIDNYIINKSGQVYSLERNKLLNEYTSTGRGYVYFILYINKKRKVYSRHKLLCITFKPNNDKTKTEIDHINGIPGDDRLENLEWVTHKENVIRYHNSITKRIIRKPVIVKFIKDEVEIEFSDHCKAANFLKIHRYELLRRLALGEKFLHKDYTFVKWKDNSNKFPVNINPEYYRKVCERKQEVKMYNHFTGNFKTFPSLRSAALYLNISESALHSRLNGKNFKILPNGWEIKYHNDYTNWLILTKEDIIKIKNGLISSRPISVTNLITKEVLNFNTIKEASLYFNVRSTTICNRMKYFKIKPDKDGNIYQYR